MNARGDTCLAVITHTGVEEHRANFRGTDNDDIAVVMVPGEEDPIFPVGRKPYVLVSDLSAVKLDSFVGFGSQGSHGSPASYPLSHCR